MRKTIFILLFSLFSFSLSTSPTQADGAILPN